MVSGDQNMIELTAAIHYRLKHPDEFLFRQLDGDTTIRAAAESALQAVVTATQLDDILTAARHRVESRVHALLQQRLDGYSAGAEILHVKLLDVHPSVEVVDAFRDVSGAFEEKNRLINEAEGYRNEQVALARGNASARLANARGYSDGRKHRSAGDAARFTLAESTARAAPAITETRLYLETMEQVLPGRRKLIVDSTRGRRHLMLVDDGVQIGPAISSPATVPPRAPAPEQEQD
jgi:HflK protein